MIKIEIGKKDYYLRGEDKQWAIGQLRYPKAKDGEEQPEPQFVGEAFYSTLEGAINNLLERKVRAADAQSLTELQLVLFRAKDELRGLYEAEVA